MPFDTALDQPDFDTEDTEAEPIPCYTGTATQRGRIWIVDIPGLPGGLAAHAKADTFREAEAAAYQATAETLDADPATFQVRVIPEDPQAADALDDLVNARVALAHAEQAVRDAARHAARTLTAQGWSTRDAGAALRVSHQRISQLTADTA